MSEKYRYEPGKGHGLPHDPFNAIIGPRPIGWISSLSAEGARNLAPYSFFNAFNYTPPIIGFSSTTLKDSARNIRETGEFVWNLAIRPLAEQMNATAASVAPGVDEFALAGLTPAPASLVKPFLVAESPVQFECLLCDSFRIKDHRGTPTEAWMILGEVVMVHIDPALLKDGVFDSFGAGIVLRAGGPSAYAEITPAARFDLRRPG